MFTLEACAKMAESLEKVLAGFVEFVMVSWVIYYLDVAIYGHQNKMRHCTSSSLLVFPVTTILTRTSSIHVLI